MADNLTFPIKFDLEAAVREAQGDADRLLRRLQTAINAKPLAVNLKIPGAGSGSINEINSRLKELARQWNNLTEAQRITNKTTGEYTAEAKKILAEYTRLRGASESYAQSLKQIDSAAKKAAKQQEKLAEAAHRGSNAFRNQEGYVSRLVKRLAVYASFQYASQFLTNIREVTAQFELQRISLGAIIQDQQKANQIFAEIKSFALTSPLKILDLTKYTKQVAAYGFETEKLFDTTKMLADISVGLGVDMSRLSLFLGQVFATGHLRSAELRQATEAGIPLVDKLAKKLEELNGRAYTAAEVMDMISKRAISYELVEQVFKDMTSAGGEFYNMQVKQSQTLFGMWSKLGDAAAIMYDQIGNTSSINAGMKLAIKSIESLMRNWKTTARVLDSVAVAMTVYVVGLKSAAVASKALTTAEATRLAITNKQIIATPKLIASIFGQNAATSISTTLTKAHTAAMIRQSTATNVLSKGFWKLTAAMLANPWVAAASAIALVGVALFHFIGNTETAAERAEKLNNSVASLKNLEDTTKPLIDTYNELINKTERTAEEQKKLSEVTHELAKQYPGAITAVRDFGTEVELAADKLNQLYQAEKQARMDKTREDLESTEQQIEKTKAEIEKYQNYIKSIEDGKVVVPSLFGMRERDAASEDELSKMRDIYLKQIEILRNGEDGQGGLNALIESAETARRALGLIPSEAAQAVEKFGAWKKTFTTFRQQVGDVRVQLFDDSTINQFGSLEEALKKTAEEYKKNIALVASYEEYLKSAELTSEERANIETTKAEADTMATLAKNALTYYNALSLLEEKSKDSGRTSDPRLQTLQEIANKMAEVNKEYDELLKKEGQTKALADTQKLFASSFKQMQATADKYGFKLPAFEVPQTIEDVQKWYKAIMDNIKRLNLKNADKVLIELGFKSDKAAIDKQQKDIEAELKRLSDRISRTKTAKEFYEKILEQTGDVELAANLSLSIYGENGEDLDKAIRENIQATLGKNKEGIDLDFSAAIRADGSVDYNALTKIAKGYLDMGEISEDTYNKILKMRGEDRKDLAKTVEGWLKATEKAKTYSDNLLDLRRKTQTEIDSINEKERRGDITPEFAESQRTGFLRKEAEEVAKLQYEAFKDSPMYVQMFDDLDNASTTMLRNMKQRIEELKTSWKDLTPMQLKEMQSRLNEIDAQLAKRNPFKGLIDGIKEYRNLRKGGDEGLDPKSEREAEKALDTAAKARLEAEKEYLEILNKEGATQEEIAKAKEQFDRAAADEDAAAKALENWKKVKDAIGLSANELFQMLNWAGDIAKGIADISEAMGADEEDVQYWNDVADALGQISGGIQDIVSAAMSGNMVGIISSTLTAIPKMFVGFTNLFSAGKIKRANKEIKRQQELLDQLEYTYGRLEKAAEKAFGADYLNNYNQQIKNLEAQQQAYLKQAQAERSKGKKADKEKIKEYEEQARDTADKIKDLQDDLVAQIVGTDVASAARDFANAWLDAYLSFGSTTDAIKEKFDDMIKNMIVNMVLAQVVKRALEPIFKMIDDLAKDGELSADDIAKVFAMVPQSMQDINNGLSVGMEALKAAGVDISKLREGSSEFSGIAKNIAGATSEEINTAAAIGNTIMYHTSHLPIISQNVAAIYELMSQGKSSALPDSGTAGWTDWQQQAMENYNAIARNTADTVVECRRAADACTAATEKLNRALRTKGATSGFNVFLNS